MKKMIFHLPVKLDKKRFSGSQIRPQKMISAFESIGYEVDLVWGDVSNRKKGMVKIKENILHGIKYDFLYSESSTMPTLLTESHHFPVAPFLDFNFFRFCKSQDIPIGLFYRDIYWMIDSFKKTIPFFKRLVSRIFYKYDLLQYKDKVDVLFVPSVEMYDYMNYDFPKKIVPLPPGTDLQKCNYIDTNNNSLNFIYVGGSGSDYDLFLFLKVLNNLENTHLDLCSRKDDWHMYKEKYQGLLKNVSVHHKNGQELRNIYDNNDVAVYFINPKEFGGFALGLKLFEYISYEKPIISVKGTAIGNFVEENDIGWSVDYNSVSLMELIKKLSENKKLIELKKENIVKAKERNSWNVRALRVVSELI
jgi:glycosyltransferase involved in cell wall biosynthesis